MRNRLPMAILFVPLIIGFIVWGGRPFFFLILAIALTGLFEFYQIVEARSTRSWAFLRLLMAAGLLLSLSFPQTLSLVIAALVMVSFLREMRRNDFPQAITNCALTIFGLFYIVGLLGHLVLLRNLEGGLGLVLTVLFITWIGDSRALIVGKSWGKYKLFPRLSPHKTIEGVLGGVGSAILASFGAYFALRAVFGNVPFPLSHVFFLGFILGITGILGDLSESLLKRAARIKDSGKNIPGYGGILDIFDSLLFTAPVMYYYALFILPL